ncbi:MAG: 3-hydroxyisobutyrate dehydrogenase [Candidatus Rokuibacteriota bacterium]|nr:MAG: 3-hydroxyisobutyrate dehydrogenase [Candidatus Rokubacteria bacterium]
MPDKAKVGFIGLGNMGQPIAGFILEAGFPLIVHDVRREAAAPLLARGARAVDSPGEVAAESDVICVCVPGPPEMEKVMLAPDGIVERVKRDTVCIDHTTNAPGVVQRVGSLLTARGAHLLDAPLDGGREGALDGQVTLFVGGDEAVLRRVKPVLDTFSKSVVWVGELGAGSVTKLVHNALAMSIDLLLTECLTLGAKAGVAVPRLVEAFREGCIVSNNMTFTKRMPSTLFRGDFAARFALKLAYKDFRLASDLAAKHGVPTRLLDLCELELLEAMNRGWGDQDRTKASTLQEERAGVTLRLPK